MSKHLPTDNFQKYGNDTITESIIDKVLRIQDYSNIGCVLLVDLTFPDNYEKKSWYFPFLSVNKTINPQNFTKYMKKH